jgi:23S rRNA pseudouridine2605 synthase
MNLETPAGRPESAPGGDPFDFDVDEDAANGPGSTGVRLNKFLAQNGVASRRGADQLIERGHVKVDGIVVTELGRRVDPTEHKVEVNGVVLRPAGEQLAYYLLNKPTGVVCTNDVREARPRAIDLITDKKKGRIFTVGRLDEDTEGLVILTNDGEFANRITHPRYGVKKTYWVDVRGRVDDEALEEMRRGVRLAEGWGKFEHVKVLKRQGERSILLVQLSEGKNREVRRVFAALRLPVRTLRRVEIGPLHDRKLKTGQWRHLTRGEVGELLTAATPASTPATTKGATFGASAARKSAKKAQGSPRRPWSAKKPRHGDERGKRRGQGSQGGRPDATRATRATRATGGAGRAGRSAGRAGNTGRATGRAGNTGRAGRGERGGRAGSRQR